MSGSPIVQRRRHRPRGWPHRSCRGAELGPKRIGGAGRSCDPMALTALVPVALSCSAVYHAITQSWAYGFLPYALTVVPFPVAAVLSAALPSTLLAVWVCQRKTSLPPNG